MSLVTRNATYQKNSPTMSKSKWHSTHHRAGSVIPMFAIMLPVVLILAAFAINIAYVELSRTEMYIAADAASRAASRQFASTNDQALARAKGREATTLNTVGGKPLLLHDNDIVFGESSRTAVDQRYSFTPGGKFPNAVEITVNRTAGSLSGPLDIPLPIFFASPTINASQTARANQIEVDVALVIDRSGSMAYGSNEPAVFPPNPSAAPPGWVFGMPAPNPSRWREAVAAVNVFLAEVSNSPLNEFVSLSSYNQATSIDCPLTNNYGDIQAAMDVYTQSFNSGFTNIGGGIATGVDSFSINSRPFAAKVIIVLTDGIDTVGSDPVAAAQLAKDNKVQVFAITFSSEADQATMQDVASTGRGKHYHATNGASLSVIFRDIARQLPILISR